MDNPEKRATYDTQHEEKQTKNTTQYSLVCFMVLNATFNNISFTSRRSVLLVEDIREDHRPVASHWQTLLHNVVHIDLIGIRTHNISISCKFNYHTITTPKQYLLDTITMGRSPNYGRNSNILIPDPYHYWIKFLAPEANTEIRMRSNLELLPVMNVNKWLKIAVCSSQQALVSQTYHPLFLTFCLQIYFQ